MLQRVLIGRKQLYRRLKQPGSLRIKQISSAFDNLSINHKLNVGFGVLVGLTFLVVGRNYWGSLFATDNINRTQQVRVPTVLASAQAQEDLLKMSAHVRGYLITGQSDYRNSYHLARQEFEREFASMLAMLETYASSENRSRLAELTELYELWKGLPEELFALSDQPLDNQPALKDFTDTGDFILLNMQSETQQLVDLQAERSPSAANTQLLKEIAAFQNSFALMGASLRAYLITRDADFRFEYAGYLLENDQQREIIQTSVDDLTPSQRQVWEGIGRHRQRFLDLAPELLTIVEGDRYREDLFVFSTQAEPLAEEMLALLEEIVTSQQNLLTNELATGKTGLIDAQWQTLLGSFLALCIALGMALLLRQKIADPIVRLTQATAQVMEGDFDAKATVESGDEIGTLAKTFNRMTDYIKQSHQNLERYNATLERQKREVESKNIQIEQALSALQETQSQLIQTEKMSSLGQMVAGIAHEINNPASFIHGNLPCAQEYAVDLIELLQLYQHTYPQASPEIEEKSEAVDLDFLLEDLPRTFQSMAAGTDRIRKIVESLRNFSRLDESDMKQATLREGIDSTLLILQSRLSLQSFRPEIAVIKRYGDVHPIECYPGQLNQVFLNILANAIDAIDSASHQRDFGNWQPQIAIATKEEQNQIVLSISDNGEGIEPDNQPRIFDPFFTTRPVGQGTGMGLSVCHKIVADRHNGELSCESVPGEGTTFYIKIPLHQKM